MKYYKIENIDMPWGDYGDILFSGMLNVMDEDYNEIDVHELERTGPYVPDIYKVHSTNLVINKTVKSLIEKNNITGIERFHDIINRKIVHIDWKSWDLDAPAPKFYPESGEPEDYIEEGTHDESLSKEIKNLYSLKIKEIYELIEIGDDLAIQVYPEYDIFVPTNMNTIIVSESFKNVIESNGIKTLTYKEIKNLK